MSGQLSPDGLYFWDGASWQSSVSPDSKFRWDGTQWAPNQPPSPETQNAINEGDGGTVRHVNGLLKFNINSLENADNAGTVVGTFAVADITKVKLDRTSWLTPLGMELVIQGQPLRFHKCSPNKEVQKLVAVLSEAGAEVTIGEWGKGGGFSRLMKASGQQARKEGQWAVEEPTVQVKTYDSAKEYESDAQKMITDGWRMEGQSQSTGNVKMGRTLVKAGIFLPWAVMRPARKGGKLTVTWVKANLTSIASAPATSSVATDTPLDDALDQLKRLGDLRDAGILTEDEFVAKKAELLDRI